MGQAYLLLLEILHPADECQIETNSETVLEEEGGSAAVELSFGDDGDTVTQQISFVHVASALSALCPHLPDTPPGLSFPPVALAAPSLSPVDPSYVGAYRLSCSLSHYSGLVMMLSHCRPKPCSSYRDRYSVPKPKATGDNKLYRSSGAREAGRNG
ncbi:hypothetical protein EYF80_001206 [Liparis tanakae]|uniref:Uncharacterized protein n=1 Tax=Liparis tanakae TaxID=230148 RepID=A0A4Z2JF34_9TELE|nr:hypothetical protein EYF80_001206 [Liparis tanakae]